MLIFITDLDGTLLDENYSYAPALPALKMLKELKIPLVLCTSKTRAEVEVCRRLLGNRHPFIIENGGALYIPERYFGQSINTPVHRDGYAVIEFGDPHSELIRALLKASAESACPVRAFHQMSIEEICARCGMSVDAATRAKKREYDEPFEILGGDSKPLTDAIERQKKRWTRGGAFYHILGSNDKAHCVNLLIHFYTRIFGDVVSVGLGDGLNDAGFLDLVDIPILLESPTIKDLKKAVPRGRPSKCSGPRGWNTAVIEIIEQHFRAAHDNFSPKISREESATSKAFLM